MRRCCDEARTRQISLITMFVTPFAPRAMKRAMRPIGRGPRLTMIERVANSSMSLPPGPGANRIASGFDRVIIAAISAAALTCEALLRDANQRGERPPPLNVARLTAIAPDTCRLH